jgi:hypothetical protein
MSDACTRRCEHLSSLHADRSACKSTDPDALELLFVGGKWLHSARHREGRGVGGPEVAVATAEYVSGAVRILLALDWGAESIIVVAPASGRGSIKVVVRIAVRTNLLSSNRALVLQVN